jgi:hypothetical protein
MENQPRFDLDNQKLDRIIEALDKIERHLAPPPLWQRVISFTFQNFTIIISLVLLTYAVYKIWAVVSGVSENVDGIRELMIGLFQNMKDGVSGLKFWE